MNPPDSKMTKLDCDCLSLPPKQLNQLQQLFTIKIQFACLFCFVIYWFQIGFMCSASRHQFFTPVDLQS